MRPLLTVLVFTTTLAVSQAALAQDPFSKLPGYDNYRRVSKEIGSISSAGRISRIEWAKDGESMNFLRRNERFRIRLSDFSIESLGKPKKPTKQRGGHPHGMRIGRGQQSTRVPSPNGAWAAIHRDNNVVLERVVKQTNKTEDGKTDKNEATQIQVTTGGSESFRYGTGCWIYGEELLQRSAMWWSPDSRKLAFYEIDERHMRDYYLTTNNTSLYTTLQTVRYPTAGQANPYVGLWFYDLETKSSTRVNVGGDRQQYIYNVGFTPNGSELLFYRANRKQDTLEVMAADPKTGQARVVVAESQETWQNNRPFMRFLSDGQRFVWETERTGWKHYELRHLDGRLLNPLSEVAEYPVASVVRIDEEEDFFYYTAYSGQHPLNVHLHRVRLDGSKHTRLTNKPLNHTSINISPDHKWFVACYEMIGQPPTTALFNDKGKQVVVLAETDVEKAEELGLTTPELFTFKADDGETDLYGVLYKPANFDPARKYPLVVSVYGGPYIPGLSNRYSPASAHCEFGFLIAKIANRGTVGRGKKFETATYLGLGSVDIKDQADGVRFLSQRPYVDKKRVGIYGHSYGGYMSALAIVKFPEVFHVAVASSAITDWKNYDTIYTERYMRTPKENSSGYRKGSCLTYAKNLKGKLLLMHGLMDDNVHPSNVWQLVDALQRANRQFDLMIYPRSKHGLGHGSAALRWEYLHQHLRPVPLDSCD